MNNNLLVSIIMPAYNTEATIRESIKSVIKQTYTNWELIVINDGSTDKTVEFIKSFTDDRIILLEQKNLGVVNARNNGLKYSKGELIAFLDSDDLWLKEKLEIQLKFMKSNNVQFSYTKSYSFSSNSKNIKEAFKFISLGFEDKEEILIYDFIPTLTVMVHRCIIDDIGYFDTELKAAEDWDLWIRILQKYKVGFLEEYLSKYRVTGTGLSSNLYKHFIEEEKVFKKYNYLYNDVTCKYRVWFSNKKQAIISLQNKDYCTFIKYFIKLLLLPKLLIKFISLKYNG
jgi:glycosyltransferase involved in cell wall biosynthesis